MTQDRHTGHTGLTLLFPELATSWQIKTYIWRYRGNSKALVRYYLCQVQHGLYFIWWRNFEFNRQMRSFLKLLKKNKTRYFFIFNIQYPFSDRFLVAKNFFFLVSLLFILSVLLTVMFIVIESSSNNLVWFWHT